VRFHHFRFAALSLVGLLGSGDLHPHQRLGHEMLDAFEHLVEDFKALHLVLHQRILLCIRAQPYCITKILECGQVVLPTQVDLPQIVEPQEIVERFFAG